MFFISSFYLNFLTLKENLTIDNEYKSMDLPYFEGVYHTQMIETFSNVNARLVRMVHTMVMANSCEGK